MDTRLNSSTSRQATDEASSKTPNQNKPSKLSDCVYGKRKRKCEDLEGMVVRDGLAALTTSSWSSPGVERVRERRRTRKNSWQQGIHRKQPTGGRRLKEAKCRIEIEREVRFLSRTRAWGKYFWPQFLGFGFAGKSKILCVTQTFVVDGPACRSDKLRTIATISQNFLAFFSCPLFLHHLSPCIQMCSSFTG